MKNIEIPEGLREIRLKAFFGSGLTSIDLSNTSVSIVDGVFEECKNLKSVKLPDNLKEIPENLFKGCILLSDIEIPSRVENIGSSAFYGCKSLKGIIFPVSLKRLENYSVFGDCDNLKEVVIPYGTTFVGGHCFENCENLKSVFIPDTVTGLGILNIIEDSPNAIVYCTQNSKTTEYCKKHNISYLTDSSVNSGITVLYNGTRISFHSYGQNPALINSRTLVPLRSIFEAMGADVEWDGTTRTATAKRDGVTVKIQIGANEIYKNGSAISVDVPAQLLNSRTMVPARVIAEAFGADVKWNANGKTVLITE